MLNKGVLRQFLAVLAGKEIEKKLFFLNYSQEILLVD
jgi:hypothetical protein